MGYNGECTRCHSKIEPEIMPFKIEHPKEDNEYLCIDCCNVYMKQRKDDMKHFFNIQQFNEPEHYHQHEIDTIEFLKRGFPPHVLTGFLIGNIVKYTQRFEYKNGEDDLLKVVDYSQRLLDWYREIHKK